MEYECPCCKSYDDSFDGIPFGFKKLCKEYAYKMADAMLEARYKEEELGIAAVKTKRQYVRKTYNK